MFLNYFYRFFLKALCFCLFLFIAVGIDSFEQEKNGTSQWKNIMVKPNDTFFSLLHNENIKKAIITSLLQADKNKVLQTLQPGKNLFLHLKNREIAELRYYKTPLQYIVFKKTDPYCYISLEINEKTETIWETKSFAVKNTLFGSAQHIGLNNKLTQQLVALFENRVHFPSELKKGDRFSFVYEQYYSNGQKVGTGPILAAELIQGKKNISAVRYTDKTGYTGYYSIDGESMELSFNRDPLNFIYISSGFTDKRVHPIHGVIKPHRAIDYVAPIDTPVRVTSDGVVAFLGYKKGYGKVIFVRHKNNIETVYAHLNHYSRNLRKGLAIKKGQLIGYVGMTGDATGPHLHYEFKVNGVHKNPLTINLPYAAPITKEEAPFFTQHVKSVMSHLHNVPMPMFAMGK